MPRSAAGVGALLALSLLIAGCSAPQQQPVTGPTSAPPMGPTDHAPEPTQAPTPTCDTIVSPSLVEKLTGLGWTAKEDVFSAGDTALEGGIQCTWADFDGHASDNLLVYGWAPIDETAARALQSELVSQGWVREDDGGSVYITESPEFASSVDENGYGTTYQFGDGWVKIARTKQGLLLIDWPPAG